MFGCYGCRQLYQLVNMVWVSQGNQHPKIALIDRWFFQNYLRWGSGWYKYFQLSHLPSQKYKLA